MRLSAYKGLSSEVYIALVYPDPILQAFQLSHELRTLAKVEHYFREDYQKLANQLSIFVTRLLDNVRGHEELEIVLNKTGLPNEEKYDNLARFDLAIQYEEKPFVSHSNCQQKLMEKWYENLTPIKNAHLTKRLFFYMGFIIALPFLSLAYFCFPKSKIGSFVSGTLPLSRHVFRLVLVSPAESEVESLHRFLFGFYQFDRCLELLFDLSFENNETPLGIQFHSLRELRAIYLSERRFSRRRRTIGDQL